MVASNGFKGDSGKSNVSLYVTVSLKSAYGRPSDYWYENALFFDKLKKTDIGKKALERTLKKAEPKKIKSGKYPMIIENRVAGNLAGPLYGAFRDRAFTRSNHFLSARRINLWLLHF